MEILHNVPENVNYSAGATDCRTHSDKVQLANRQLEIEVLGLIMSFSRSDHN